MAYRMMIIFLSILLALTMNGCSKQKEEFGAQSDKNSAKYRKEVKKSAVVLHPSVTPFKERNNSNQPTKSADRLTLRTEQRGQENAGKENPPRRNDIQPKVKAKGIYVSGWVAGSP